MEPLTAERKKKLAIVGAIILVAIILLIVLVAVLNGNKKNSKCSPVKRSPDPIDVDKLQNVPSEDFKTLATAAASIYFKNDGTYLDLLSLNSVKLAKFQEKLNRLELDFECARIDFEIELIDSELTTKQVVNNVYVTLAESNQEDGYDFYLPTVRFDAPTDERYSCTEAITYVGEPIFEPKLDTQIKVTFPRLEFEFDGEPEKIKIGQYSKRPSEMDKDNKNLVSDLRAHHQFRSCLEVFAATLLLGCFADTSLSFTRKVYEHKKNSYVVGSPPE